MKMRKFLLLVLVGLLCSMLFGGCGKKEEPAPVAQVANPVEVVTQDVFIERLGFALNAPEGAENPEWHIISAGEGNVLGELVFLYDGLEYVYRAQPTAELAAYDMSGLYYEWKETVPGSVGGRDATAYTCDEAGYVAWLDVVPGFNYNLGAKGKADAQTLLAVANLVFEPLQGEVDGDEALPEYDYDQYIGSFVDHDGSEEANRVSFALNEDDTFTADVSLYRLAQLPGVGSRMDGAMEVALEDPNGGTMYGVFFPAEDGTYTLRITQSDWELLEPQTDFPGFVAEDVK